MNKNVVIIGAGGHAKVVADIIIKSGDKIAGFLDDTLEKNTKILGYNILGKITDLKSVSNEEIYFALGIGNNKTRKQIYETYKVKYYTAIHPTSVIAMDVEIGEGTVLMANTVVNTSTKIGKCCIINTGAIIEHDNILKDYVHISPNAALSGTVTVGECTHIGTGSSIKNNINICDNANIGVGSVVVKNIEKSGTYYGVPAKEGKK